MENIHIHKTHTKADLIHLTNNLNLNITISHGDSKKEIHNKVVSYYDNINDDITYKKNLYGINDLRSLKIFLCNKSPKKNVSLAERQQLLTICRKICSYCKNGYIISKSSYETEQDLKDDILYVIQFGDLPCVRRAVKLLNKNIMLKNKYECIISPSMRSQILEKEIEKKTYMNILTIKREKVIVSFD
tara:strand:+ start:1267 stop:1830 length:564 start_codon:yes stop_codon:yes gene_type:complete